MNIPNFAKDLGQGTWVNSHYIVHRCPLCSGENTLMFTGHGNWKCLSCGPDTFRDLTEFKALLRKTGIYGGIADAMDNPEAPDGLVVVSQYRSVQNRVNRISTGFSSLDKVLGGLGQSALTVITGKRGEGKSTFAGQLALNAIQNGSKVCFYSGELNASMFQSWIFAQAAGDKYMEPYVDRFNSTRYAVLPVAEEQIRVWLDDKMVLYDNTKNKSSERNSILERFALARTYFGCDLFIVDNLMTARYAIDRDPDYYRAQSNFTGQLIDFAHQQAVHVVLIAHPRKGDGGDINDNVSGSSDITNRASNVIRVMRVLGKDYAELGCDSLITVSKNRDYGHTGDIRLDFQESSKRLVALDGNNITTFGWETN